MSTIAIIDDHDLLAETLRVVLTASGHDAVRIAPAERDAIVAAVRATKADLVLLDLDLGRFGDTTPMIAPLVAVGARVLILSGVEDRVRIAAALEQGAIGHQSKAGGFDALLAKATVALTAPGPLDAADRLHMFDELHRARQERSLRLRPFRALTAREDAALRALARGCSVSQLAKEWFVSEATIRSHVRGVLTKLAVSSQLAAVALAMESGWLDEHSEAA